MCQLRVCLLMADSREEVVEEVVNLYVDPEKIRLTCLFEAPRDLFGFAVKEIDCMHNRVLLVQRTTD